MLYTFPCSADEILCRRAFPEGACPLYWPIPMNSRFQADLTIDPHQLKKNSDAAGLIGKPEETAKCPIDFFVHFVACQPGACPIRISRQDRPMIWSRKFSDLQFDKLKDQKLQPWRQHFLHFEQIGAVQEIWLRKILIKPTFFKIILDEWVAKHYCFRQQRRRLFRFRLKMH